MKGTDYKLTEDFNDEVKNTLNSATKGATPSPLVTAKNGLQAMERRNSSRTGCGILAVPCMFMEDVTQTSYAYSAKNYIKTLHLQMKLSAPDSIRTTCP
jgi:hypothetical protein